MDIWFIQARLAHPPPREAGRTTVQHVAGYERQSRHATLVAISMNLSASLTDQAVDLLDRLVGAMLRKAEGRQARTFQADADRPPSSKHSNSRACRRLLRLCVPSTCCVR